ncbi:hypothetical protein L1987_05788 [Smallanthus sonchifolius]|uniref:Uncharacterized protein n=1 Tax=Smallanthus sonchifolius TaxID=185202 RepID=A0ACB9JWI0_9ASTR|nr:hypothetical protein L1987_05788 [Smallanthus sonchifolius]
MDRVKVLVRSFEISIKISVGEGSFRVINAYLLSANNKLSCSYGVSGIFACLKVKSKKLAKGQHVKWAKWVEDWLKSIFMLENGKNFLESFLL